MIRRMHAELRVLTVLVAVGASVACSSPANSRAPQDAPREDMEERRTAESRAPEAPADAEASDFVFVFLKTGPQSGRLDATAAQEASTGHFANMARLADDGDLLVAGPFGEPRADPLHRGVFIFDAATVEEAAELTSTDPAVLAGVFVFDAYPLRSRSPLRRVPAILRAAEERGEVSADDPGKNIRPYFLVTSTDADAADVLLSPLADEGLILFSGHFGGELEGTSIYALIAETLEEAEEMLAFATQGADLGWKLHPWLASASLLELLVDSEDRD